MSIREETIDAMEELESDLQDEAGETQKLILPSNAEIPCVPSTEEVGTAIGIGGQSEIITAVVRVRKSWFVTADSTVITADSDVILADNSTGRPRSGGANYRTGGFRGKNYRVLKVAEDPSGAYFKIFMGSAR